MDMEKFCTCSSKECPLHPTNHDKGCTPCIEKNLSQREIPSCFFKLVAGTDKFDSFYFEDFARIVLKEDNK